MSGLESEFPGKVIARNVDATTPESKQAIRDLGFKNHGIVIRTSTGQVVWKQADHEVKLDDVRVQLRASLPGT